MGKTYVITCPTCGKVFPSYASDTTITKDLKSIELCPVCRNKFEWRPSQFDGNKPEIIDAIIPKEPFTKATDKEGFETYRFDSQEAFNEFLSSRRGGNPTPVKRDNTDFGSWFRR